MYCVICNKSVGSEGNTLVNGSMYHLSCHDSLLTKLQAFEVELKKVRLDKVKISRKLNPPDNFITRVTSLFLNPLKNHSPKIDVNELTQTFEKVEKEERSVNQKIKDTKSQLYLFYTFWPTYPPDWETRRQIKLSEQNSCEECGSYRNLQVHHLIRIGNGGSHRQSNLCVLCEKCHRKKHGGRKFSYRSNTYTYSKNSNEIQDSAFSKRLKKINEAISQGKFIKFSYQKFNETKSSRTIKPTHLEQVGKSLCIHGWCYLRNAKRVFAIKRMKWVKIVNNIPQKKASSISRKPSPPKKRTKKSSVKSKPAKKKLIQKRQLIKRERLVSLYQNQS